MGMSEANDKHPALIRAQTYLRSADLLLDTGDHASAISRSYYAMFFIARAQLQEIGIETKTHSGLRRQFGKHFVRDGDVKVRFAKMLSEAEDLRAFAEYAESPTAVTEEDARVAIDNARSFVQTLAEDLTP